MAGWAGVIGRGLTPMDWACSSLNDGAHKGLNEKVDAMACRELYKSQPLLLCL